MSDQRLPIIPFDVQDQLADAQHAIYAASRRKQLEDDFVFGRLRALLGTTLPTDTPRRFAPGLLAYLQYEVYDQLFAGSLDPQLTLQALTSTLDEGRQQTADRFAEQLSRDLDELAERYPEAHKAYHIVRINQSSRDYAAWLEQLSVEVHPNWGTSDQSRPATMSERLLRYVERRKDVASKAEQQMKAVGFEANSSHIRPVQFQAAVEASVFSAAFSFWDALRLSWVRQTKPAASAA